MNNNFFLLLIAAFLFVLCLMLVAVVIVNRIRINKLNQSVDEFFKSGKLTEISTSDGVIANLQTNICELETRLLLERENTRQESKNNTEFISDISHQLKTPLAGIRLYCEMEYSASPDAHTEKELELISKMEKLIYNVLMLEKIRSDTYVMNFEKHNVSEILNELKLEFLPLFPQKQIAVNGTGLLRCDKVWLREAFGNIIKNACEHTPPNGRIDVTIEKSEKSVSVTFEDNGGGVPENELLLLFRRFHRSQNASPDSAGVGLAITKAIIEKHHGTIIAENGEKGLKISICFPIIDASVKL